MNVKTLKEVISNLPDECVVLIGMDSAYAEARSIITMGNNDSPHPLDVLICDKSANELRPREGR